MWYNGDMVLQAKKKFGLPQLAAVTNESIKSAGERYFNVPELRGLEIEAFDNAVKGLIGGKEFHALVDIKKENILEAWKDAGRWLSGDYSGQLPEPHAVIRGLEDLANAAPGCGASAFASIRDTADIAHEQAKALAGHLYEKTDKGNFRHWDNEWALVSQYANKLDQIKHFQPQQAFSRIRGMLPYMRADAPSVHDTGALILCSEWGMGKTHSLCFLAEQSKRKHPVLLVLAKDLKDFIPEKSPGDALALYTGLATNFDELLQQLNTLGRKRKERALLLVDGINEGDHDNVWAKELGNFLRQVGKFPFVGVIVSYRYPFRHNLPAEMLGKVSFLQHPGFNEIPFAAQTAFLKYYGIPTTDVPLMADEFTRPLMLKMFCEIFDKLSKKKKSRGFAGFASGLDGMTFILERFIIGRSKRVMKKHKYLTIPKGWDRYPLWQFVKEKVADYMAEHLTEAVPAAVVLNALCESFSIRRTQARKMLLDMEKEGIVTRWRGIPRRLLDTRPTLTRNGKPRWITLVGMPYQIFSDHLIARSLFELHMNKPKSVSEVRRCFGYDQPLGKIFAMDKYVERFCCSGAQSGIAEALILEFPERIKSIPNIKRHAKELLFYLPDWREKKDAYCDPFFRGLYWRKKTSISLQTVQLIGDYLNGKEQHPADTPYSFSDIISPLLSVACRHNLRPLARWLYKRIKIMKMADRDIGWGAATHRVRESRWANNLLLWLSQKEADGFKEITVQSARNYIALLSLFLGSTDRPLRDGATKALVAIGEKFPADLFKHTLDTLGFDDIYYPERMLAACYGVAMSKWASPKTKKFRREFRKFVRAIVRDVFMPGGRLLTHHALVRDYALGMVAIARELGEQFSEIENMHMSRPFPAISSPFRPADEIDETKFKMANRALYDDFHEYDAVPGLVFGQDNRGIKRQVRQRVMDLGYLNETFAEQDNLITEMYGRHSLYKVDRFGEKYSWIAYYEMHGLLYASGAAKSEYRDPTRPAVGIIDPTFMIPPRKWDPKFKRLSMDGKPSAWITQGTSPDYGHILEIKILERFRGPWIMLKGQAVHKKQGTNRRGIYSYLRGILVNDADLGNLRATFNDAQRPEDFFWGFIDYYIFAGEIPWSHRFLNRQEPDEYRHMNAPGKPAAFEYGWETHHSRENQLSEVYFPAPEICAHFSLQRRGRGSALFDKSGKVASLYHSGVRESDTSVQDEFRFLHLRKDLLDAYLRATGKRLVWVICGNRRILEEWTEEPPADMGLSVHKRLILYGEE